MLERKCFQILMALGPSGPSGERKQVNILPAGNYEQTEVAHLRNWGSGGNDCEHRRRQGAHRKRPPVTLWFLSGDTERNPPRRAEPSKQKSGSDADRHSHKTSLFSAKTSKLN